MSSFVKGALYFGLACTIVGCFLPWGIYGDFVSFTTYGLRLSPPVEDNGGLLIVLLSLLTAWLVFRPPTFLKTPTLWAFASSVGITLATCFHILKWLVARSNAGNVVGPPTLRMGLFVVLVGALMLLVASSAYYFKMSRKEI